MNIEIREIEDRSALKQWVRFPLSHYKDHPQYVPQLLAEEVSYFDKDRNPVFEVADARLFLAMVDGKTVGRICGIIHSLETEKLGYKRGRFGWFESIDDQAVANALLDTLKNWFEEEGCAEITGPHGFSDLDIEGLLIEGFDAIPTIAGCYNYPYYRTLLENYGFTKDVDYFDCRFEVPERIPFFERARARHAKDPVYRVETCPNRKALRARIGEMWALLEESFEPVYGVIPITRKQKDYYTKKYFGFLDPKFVKFLFSPDEVMVGFLVAFPNLSNAFRKARGRLLPFGFLHILKDLRSPETIDFALAGSKPGHPSSLLTAIGLADMFDTLREAKIRFVESNHELEDNKTIYRIWNRFEKVNERRSRIFKLALT